MHFRDTPIEGVIEISSDWYQDERGKFGRIFCRREFASKGLHSTLAQCSISINPHKGTLRGFHLQTEPCQEAKLIQCLAGRLFDVALDLRPQSSTRGRFHSVELTASAGRMLYIPQGCAHAFQTMEDDTTILYYISEFYQPETGRGVRWDDPEIGVPWPLTECALINARDRDLPTLAQYKAIHW